MTNEEIRDLRAGVGSKNLEGKTFWNILFIDPTHIKLRSFTPKLNLHLYEDAVNYQYYSTEEEYNTNDFSGNKDYKFCSKYIEDGFWITPEKAIQTWIAWKDHYKKQDPQTVGAKYQTAFESEEFQKIKDLYPHLFI